jgi:hypothetical protein
MVGHIYSYRDVLQFGRYFGKPVCDVMILDPGYLKWCKKQGVCLFDDYVSILLDK